MGLIPSQCVTRMSVCMMSVVQQRARHEVGEIKYDMLSQ